VVSAAAGLIITHILDGLLGHPPLARLGWDTTTYILIGTGRLALPEEGRAMLGPDASRFPLLR